MDKIINDQAETIDYLRKENEFLHATLSEKIEEAERLKGILKNIFKYSEQL